ncbi:hypothetical protein [Rhodoferax saidenbachensis]|nr:hypothetical protein [Rhodoferax saidenbachensis]
MPKNNTPDNLATVVRVDEDRALDRDLQVLLVQIREGHWSLYGA